MRRFPEDEYHIPFFDEEGYVRKKCPLCGEYFWTQNPDQEFCGESTPEGCAQYTFIGNPPTRKAYSYREMRELFLSFFEEHDHKRIKPYPVVARWRDDLFFTHASIIDFQPYVTEGIIPPPANPLVISQPCLRFVDIDNVGLTFGRHLTIFEMGGHHAFNSPTHYVYWKDETVRYHHEFLTEKLGVKSEEIIYKEGVWVGGGNAGPDVEGVVRGLEISTLVFMKFKVVNGEFIELPIKTVDTGYGIERFTWLSQGSASCFHAVYTPILNKVLSMLGVPKIEEKLLINVARISGIMNLEKGASRISARSRVASIISMDAEELDRILTPLESAFAILDHTKCLAFMLAEGVVPSNVREGYLARLLLRRTYKLLRLLESEYLLPEIVKMQIEYWSQDYPHLKEMEDTILEILSIEEKKFRETLKRGMKLVKRISSNLKSENVKKMPIKTLIELYDSHGLPPEIVKEVAEPEGVVVEVPDSFYMMIAERHVSAPPKQVDEEIKGLKNLIANIPATRQLFYENQYMKRFKAKVLRVLEDKYVILDETAFYPEGGGQLSDTGYLIFDDGKCEILDVKRIGNVIVHKIKGTPPKEGVYVIGEIDWNRRLSLMRHHTATHVLLGATRRVLGEHVWQAGAQKEVDKARLDITHYKHISFEELKKIELLANNVVMRNINVETSWMPREEAEAKYGFRLYQGGVVPGREIRVVKIGDWDVEACGGTHCKNTGEIGFIRVIRAERVQDGIERLIFCAGPYAIKAVQESDRILHSISESVGSSISELERAVKQILVKWKEARREANILSRLLAEYEAKEMLLEAEEISGVKLILATKRNVSVDHLIEVANKIVELEPKSISALFKVDDVVNLVVSVGSKALEMGIKANEVAFKAAKPISGGGSGKPNFAQAGGTRVEGVEEAKEIIKKYVREVLS